MDVANQKKTIVESIDLIGQSKFSIRRPHETFTNQEVAEIFDQDGSDAERDFESKTGDISSGEVFDLDQELEGNHDSEREWR